MRLFSVTTAVCISLLSVGLAGASWYRAEQLRSEASWLMERSKAQASEYAQSFDDRLATQQLETFARRRAVLEQAYLWQRGQTLGILLAAAAAVGAWVLSLLRKLTGELEEVHEDMNVPVISPPPERAPVSLHAHIQRSRT
jgi:hypothetical protein